MSRNPDTSEEGLERLRAAVRANPRSTTFVALAHRLCDAGRAVEAEEVCRDGLVRHPGLVTGQVALGRSLLDRGRLREAQEVLIEAARANPDHGDAFRWLGEVTIRRGDLPRARVLLEYAEELSPHDRRVSELLTESGGSPTFRAPRPKTDFEHTRVGNARALAERMHEDPDALGDVTRVAPPLGQVLSGAAATLGRGFAADGFGLDDPTVLDGAATLQALAAQASATPAMGTAGPASRATPVVPLRSLSASPAADDEGAVTPPPRAEVGAARSSEPSLADAAEESPSGDFAGPPRPTGVRRPLTALRASGPRTPWDRARMPVLVAGSLALVGAAAGLVYLNARTRQSSEGPHLQMRDAISAGSLASLLRARDLGRELLAASPSDASVAAALAFASALLAHDYGLPARGDAEAMVERAAAAKEPPAKLVASIEATRSILALGAGELPAALQAAARATAADSGASPALLASARVKANLGDLDGARRDLERLLELTPELSAAVIDWASVWLDLGDPATAAQSLQAQLARTGDHLRARLLLAEAQRATGERRALEALEAGCRVEGKQSPALGTSCALSAASEARLAGERGLALKHARTAAAECPDDPRLLSATAVQLATLGEIDHAAELLGRARRLAGETAAPIVWADTAVRLGRREPVTRGPLLEKATGPERRLIAVRAALAADGVSAMGAVLKRTPPGLVAFDPDLKALAYLAREGEGSGSAARAERAELERRAERGDPLAAYVLGRAAERSGDRKGAARRLEKALVGHGDACEAAALFAAVMQQADRPAAGLAGLRALRSHNSQCVAVQPASVTPPPSDSAPAPP